MAVYTDKGANLPYVLQASSSLRTALRIWKDTLLSKDQHTTARSNLSFNIPEHQIPHNSVQTHLLITKTTAELRPSKRKINRVGYLLEGSAF